MLIASVTTRRSVNQDFERDDGERSLIPTHFRRRTVQQQRKKSAPTFRRICTGSSSVADACEVHYKAHGSFACQARLHTRARDSSQIAREEQERRERRERRNRMKINRKKKREFEVKELTHHCICIWFQSRAGCLVQEQIIEWRATGQPTKECRR